ncbi:Crp/Fnr family transcriptional regulator [Niabella aurantiaca]|uniref:Crp/Fnr family transcriptional regulator n=1 Tax=Niabella aurantiaca TaxID=379900 RepID=UPI0003732046|nr:Crp/Fnr family transcriptional regulator [Niabella aurantiaca]
MHQNSFFSGLTEKELAVLNSNKSCSCAKKGRVIFSEGGMPSGLFCISKGKIKLSAVGFDGKEQILRLAKPGDIIGYRSLLSNDRYHCTAVALEDVDYCYIEKDCFLKLVHSNRAFCSAIFKKISADLRNAEQLIVSMSQKNVRERMAEALLFLKNTYGLENDGTTLNIQLSRIELADYVGTSTESAIRVLSEFNHDKLIGLSGKRIRLLDLEKLTRTANPRL